MTNNKSNECSYKKSNKCGLCDQNYCIECSDAKEHDLFCSKDCEDKRIRELNPQFKDIL